MIPIQISALLLFHKQNGKCREQFASAGFYESPNGKKYAQAQTVDRVPKST